MLRVIEQDFMRTARAKGVTERTVVARHALRNALLPVITILALALPGLIGGSVIIESIFENLEAKRALFARLEARELLLRIDPSVQPTTYRCAVVSTTELAQLRRVRDVVRMVREDCRMASKWGILALAGVEVTHVPPSEIGSIARAARATTPGCSSGAVSASVCAPSGPSAGLVSATVSGATSPA